MKPHGSQRPLLDPDLLKAIVAVVDFGGFTAAAARLHSTQSTVSQKIRRLEDLVGHRLLDRSGRTIQLTDAGQALLGHARQLLMLNDQILDMMAGATVALTVRLGVPEDFVASRTTQVLADFSRRHPQVKLEITSGLCSGLVASYDRGELDLILTKQRHHSRAAVASRPETLAWIDSVRHPCFQADPVPLVTFPPRGLYREDIIRAIEAMGRSWRIAYTCSSLNGLQNAVAAGLGISLLPLRTVTQDHVILGAREGLPAINDYEIGLFHRPMADATVRALAQALADMLTNEALEPNRS
ncbi:MAG: LysR substrate-binding domain-containing protein [Castellaniella sp.]|uniref:LysR substrate-binding domain-containing protein n=1 Tax=Castellaniella sp. TaxID=1955812 RepID=UPI002A3656D1|nr:LysR substrate-binding domain-containing protein [Castellaniella sp.]MDY0308885.1 LysR substrate-binding domain-containing protein [Castellaniella sp.]